MKNTKSQDIKIKEILFRWNGLAKREENKEFLINLKH